MGHYRSWFGVNACSAALFRRLLKTDGEKSRRVAIHGLSDSHGFDIPTFGACREAAGQRREADWMKREPDRPACVAKRGSRDGGWLVFHPVRFAPCAALPRRRTSGFSGTPALRSCSS